MGQRPPHKLATNWHGPYEVVRRLRGEYEVLDTNTNDLLTFSEHLLQPYHVDDRQKSPAYVAMVQKDMFGIEKVLDIQGDPKRRTTWNLLIQWEGYDKPELCGWNSTLLRNAMVHDKLRTMGGEWVKHIPREFR